MSLPITEPNCLRLSVTGIYRMPVKTHQQIKQLIKLLIKLLNDLQIKKNVMNKTQSASDSVL